MSLCRVIMPIANTDFDPTEVALSWKILRESGIDVVFATPDGKPGRADPIMVTGEGLDIWGNIPGLKKLKLLGLALRADRFGREA